MKFEKTDVWGFEHALRGMRNPKNSWSRNDTVVYDKTDSDYSDGYIGGYKLNEDEETYVLIGDNDLQLAQTLIAGGSEHRKFLRQIFVSVDITAPLFWWKEFDTYKVGTVANSTSTMHKLATTPITIDCFETDDYDGSIFVSAVNSPLAPLSYEINNYIEFLERLRKSHLHYADAAKREGITDAERKHFQSVAKKYWKELIRWLPESWLQKRTVTLNYENIYTIIRQRCNHKLNEWSGKDNPDLPNFISWAKTLPYAHELLFVGLN